jgi:hypothetical protein
MKWCSWKQRTMCHIQIIRTKILILTPTLYLSGGSVTIQLNLSIMGWGEE